jgi:hypothetical protein
MTTIQNRRVGQSAPYACPTVSTDLNLVDFNLWGHLKNTMNVMTVKDVVELQNRVEDGGNQSVSHTEFLSMHIP